eukprot:6213608-Pleurochrysis_carterae.AAC.10
MQTARTFKNLQGLLRLCAGVPARIEELVVALAAAPKQAQEAGKKQAPRTAMFYVVPVATNSKTVVYMGLRAILGCSTGSSRLCNSYRNWRLSTIGQVEY